MTSIIPRELIKHLEWVPGQEPLQQEQPKPVTPIQQQNILFSLDDILKGRTFYSEEKDSNDNYIGTAVALQEALDFANTNGIVATMPELIAAKVKADKDHDFWNKWYTVHTEENIGIDFKGRFYSRDEPVLVVVNGGGILTPERIREAIDEGLISNSAKYHDDEFDRLLDGRLPNGESINLYRFEEIKEGVSDLPHKFGVVMPYRLAQETKSGWHQKQPFLENPLVIARIGGLENLEAYYEKGKDSANDMGSWHPFKGRDASVAQGRLLFLYNRYGLVGDNILSNLGRFLGVAAEPHSARK